MSEKTPLLSDMAIRPVRQSASKEAFLQALNLDLTRFSDRQIFSTMWEEVTQHWVKNFETESRHILKPEYAGNLGVKQPYKWGHLNREAIDCAIDEIWNAASQRSRPYYDLGQSADQNVHNWVLKWLLWHVARYRDERNNKKNRGSDGSSASSPYSSPGQETMYLAIRPREEEPPRPMIPPPRPPHMSQRSSSDRDFWSTVMNGKPS